MAGIWILRIQVQSSMKCGLNSVISGEFSNHQAVRLLFDFFRICAYSYPWYTKGFPWKIILLKGQSFLWVCVGVFLPVSLFAVYIKNERMIPGTGSDFTWKSFCVLFELNSSSSVVLYAALLLIFPTSHH